MKKTLISLCLLIATNILLIAQPEFKQSRQVIGHDIRQNKDIEANVLEFKNYIYGCQVDTTNNQFIIQVRETNKDDTRWYSRGILSAINMTNKEVAWFRNIRLDEEQMEKNGDIIMMESGFSSSRINLQTGEEMWVSSVIPFRIIPRLNIMLGYKSGSSFGSFGNKLCCVDLISGKVRWSRTITSGSGINDVYMSNDSTLVVMASGLHQMNVLSGEGWDNSAKMISKDYSKSIATSAAGIALGVLTGFYVYRTGADIVSDLNSNLEKAKKGYYFASNDSLQMISETGKTLWRQALNRKAGSSVLWQDSTHLYLLNTGYSYYNSRKISYSTPWLASYDKTKGTPNYFNELAPEKKPIVGYKKNNDTLDIYLSDERLRTSLQSGNANIIKFDTTQGFAIHSLIKSNLYYTVSDSVFRSVKQQFPSHTLAAVENGDLALFDQAMQRVLGISLKQLYELQATYNGYLFLTKDKHTQIVDPQGHLVMELEIGNQLFIHDHQLYIVNKHMLYEMDLDELVK